MCDHKEVSITWTEPDGTRWNVFFYTTCLWPLPVHTWVLSGIIIPPLLHDPGRNSICVIHQLETSDIGSTLPEFGQVNVHESLVEERNRRSLSEEDISKWEGGSCLWMNMADSSGKISSLWEEMSNSEDTTVPKHGANLLFSQVLSWPYRAVTTQGDK